MFTGSLPSGLGGCEGCNYLNFGYNKLTGTVPTSFHSMSALSFLYIYSNEMTGVDLLNSIPGDLGNIDASFNYFSGTLPFSAAIYSFKNLYVRGNFFDGSLPLNVPLLADVRILDLSENQFSGTLGTQFQSVSFYFCIFSSFSAKIVISCFCGCSWWR